MWDSGVKSRPAAAPVPQQYPTVLTVYIGGDMSDFSGAYGLTSELSDCGGPVYQQSSGRCLRARRLYRMADSDGRQLWNWEFTPAGSCAALIEGAKWSPQPQEVPAWEKRLGGRAVPEHVSVLVPCLSMGGQELTEQGAALHDVGLSAEAEVELVAVPTGELLPAEDGPLVIYCRAPALGVSDPVCLEVAADATVGQLAALAAQRMGLARG
eukprot:TRINITY_DN8460_c0_g1_i1.p1 TRINITY_DN8460_c0_g1~~TRINITY_DN8460_c0_g1_i1.p1  ORF type:complete len:234 (+),score=60.76 TRINITY_DN8460_c0_g1_i1:72-704(+)